MRRGILILSLLISTASRSVAGEVQSVASYVPDGAVLVLRGFRLGSLRQDLEGSALASVVCDGPLARFMKDSGKLGEIRQTFREADAALGFKIWSTLKKLAGEEIICAVYSSKEHGRPAIAIVARGEAGVNAESIITEVLQKLARSGEITMLDPVYAGEANLTRFRNKRGDEMLTASEAEYTLLTNSLRIADTVVGLYTGQRTDSIVANPRARKACGNLAEDAHLAFFLDTQAVLSAMRAHRDMLPQQAHHVAKLLEALEGVAGATTIHGTGISSRYRIVVDTATLPEYFKTWFGKPDQRSWFADYIPGNVIVAGGVAQINVGGLAKAILSEFPPEARTTIKTQSDGFGQFLVGGSLLDEFLPAIGPDMALLLTDMDQTDQAPGELTLLVRIANEKGTTMMEALAGKVYGWMQLTQGPDEAAKITLKKDGDTVVVAQHGTGISPAMIVTPTACIVSSSAATATTMQGWLATPPANAVKSEIPAFKGGLWGANLTALGQWMRRHADVLARYHARKEGVPVEEAKQWMELLGDTMAQMNTFIARGTAAPGAYEIVAELSVE